MNIDVNIKVEQEQHHNRNTSRRERKRELKLEGLIKERNIGRVGNGPKGKGIDREGEMA